MENHGYEEAMKMESTTVVKLMKEIDYKNQKLLEMEHKYDETTTTVRKLVVGLTLDINRKDRSLLEVEQKLDESSITVRWLENEKEKLHEEHQKQGEVQTRDGQLTMQSSESQRKKYALTRTKGLPPKGEHQLRELITARANTFLPYLLKLLPSAIRRLLPFINSFPKQLWIQ